MIELIRKALLQDSTFFSGKLKPQEKSIYFSLLSLMLLEEEGVIVIVTPNHTYLKEKLRRINNLLNWASINP
jgi:hypothetical protein